MYTEGRPAHHSDWLLSPEQAAGSGGVQLTDAAWGAQGGLKTLACTTQEPFDVLLTLSCKHVRKSLSIWEEFSAMLCCMLSGLCCSLHLERNGWPRQHTMSVLSCLTHSHCSRQWQGIAVCCVLRCAVPHCACIQARLSVSGSNT